MSEELHPYALNDGDGWTYNLGIDFTVKVGELAHRAGVAVFEYTTRKGEEPGEHTHPTEDEIFYVLHGALTFRCGDRTFDVEQNGFVFLPSGRKHSYTIRSEGDVRLLVITSPAGEHAGGGWGGFAADIESSGNVRTVRSSGQ